MSRVIPPAPPGYVYVHFKNGTIHLVAKPTLLHNMHDLVLSTRLRHALENTGITYIGELLQKTRVEMLLLKNFGRKTRKELEELLLGFGLELGAVIPQWPKVLKERLDRGALTPEKIKRESVQNFLRTDLYNFILKRRTLVLLDRADIRYVGDLVQKNEHDLMRINGFSEHELDEVKSLLKSHGLVLDCKIKGWKNIRKREKLVI